MSLGAPQTLPELLTAIEAEVLAADTRFQLLQANAWSTAQHGRPLLEGYDRLTNLGLFQLTMSLALVAVRGRWWQRLYHWFTGSEPEPRFRLATEKNESSALRITVAYARDAQGRWARRPATAGPSPTQ